MLLRSVLGGSIALFVSAVVGAAVAAPLNLKPYNENISLPYDLEAHCEWQAPDAGDVDAGPLADAIETMDEFCASSRDYDANLLGFANGALSNWISNFGSPNAQVHQNRFLRAVAALEAQTNLLPINDFLQDTDPALMLEPLTPPSPEDALFTVEETAVPFLGMSENELSRVQIAVQAPGYTDLFTIYFPRGTAHLTLAAEDMIALAAESVRGMDGLEVWIASPSALNKSLSVERTAVVYEILRSNDVSRYDIRIDDGGYDAILNRPESLSNDTAT